MEMFLPSVQPSLLSSCRNAATRTWLPEALVLSKYPMRKILLACCASAPADPNANVRTVARIPANFGYFDIAQYRFWIGDPSAKLRARPESIEGTSFRLSDKEPKNRILQ